MDIGCYGLILKPQIQGVKRGTAFHKILSISSTKIIVVLYCRWFKII